MNNALASRVSILTGHQSPRTDLFRALALRARGFEIEPEIATQLLRRGEPIFEVPVHYAARSHAEGKKLRPLDGVRVALLLVTVYTDEWRGYASLQNARLRPRPGAEERRGEPGREPEVELRQLSR